MLKVNAKDEDRPQHGNIRDWYGKSVGVVHRMARNKNLWRTFVLDVMRPNDRP